MTAAWHTPAERRLLTELKETPTGHIIPPFWLGPCREIDEWWRVARVLIGRGYVEQRATALGIEPGIFRPDAPLGHGQRRLAGAV